MTWPQIAWVALLTIGLVIAWARYSTGGGWLRRLGELYLWLLPVSSGVFSLIHDLAGLDALVGAAIAHLLLVAVALRMLIATSGKAEATFESRSARLAGILLIVGAAIVWVGAASYPGIELESIAAHRADHLITTGSFLLGVVITLAGFTVLTATLREAGDRLLSRLGLVSFLFGSSFWVIHLAFRATIMVTAAQETLSAGAPPAGFEAWRLWAGVMYGAYMTTAYLAIAAYGGAMLKTSWAGRGWGRTFVVFGLAAAALFIARVSFFDMPLTIHFMPFVMGMLLLRRGCKQ